MAAAPQSLLQQFTSCCLAFEQIIHMTKESWWEEDHCRLQLWAGDVSLRRKGKSSLEYKLRDASNLHEVLAESFGDLSDTLQEAINIQSQNNLLTRSPTEDGSNEDTKAKYEDIQSDENQPERNRNDNENSLIELHNTVVDIIDDLYSLSTTLLCPSSHDQITDPVYQTITPVPHLNDIQHVRETYPTTPGWLCKRLGRGNAQRRLRLLYFKERAKDTGAREIAEATRSKAKSKITSSTLSTRVDSVFDEPVPQLEYDSEASGSSATSFASTTTKEGHGLRNGIPKPPAKFFENTAFECPICFSMLDDIQSLKQWKRHALEDLKPYMCTHKNCRQVEVLFARRRQWFQHELSTHFVHWFCNANGCGERFDDEELFIKHLETNHSSTCGKSQLIAIAGLCKVRVDSNSTFTCPLCFKESKSKNAFRHHLGRELVTLSLFVLPPSDIVDSDSESSVESENEDDILLNGPSENALNDALLDIGERSSSSQGYHKKTSSTDSVPKEPEAGLLLAAYKNSEYNNSSSSDDGDSSHERPKRVHRSPSDSPLGDEPIPSPPMSDGRAMSPHLPPRNVHRSPSSSPELDVLIPPSSTSDGDIFLPPLSPKNVQRSLSDSPALDENFPKTSAYRCPTCAANGQESWALMGRECGLCGTTC